MSLAGNRWCQMIIPRRRLHCLLLLVLFPGALGAQVPRPIPARAPWIRTGELVAVAALIGGGFAIDGTVRGEAQANRTGGTNRLAALGNGFGNLVYLGPALGATWAVGAITHNKSIRMAALDAFGAGVIAGGITGVLKFGFGRARPNRGTGPGDFQPFSKNASFPSGHTTLAMAVASSLAHSTEDHWSDVAFYGAALVTGYARINDDKHWLSDIITGGAIGFLVGRQLQIGRGKITPVVGGGLVGGSVTF